MTWDQDRLSELIRRDPAAGKGIPTRRISSIRDLLVITLAPDLHAFLESKLGPGAQLHAPPGAMQEIIAFVLDHITTRAFELLAQQDARTTPPPNQDRTQ
jgi:hypothetical protein